MFDSGRVIKDTLQASRTEELCVYLLYLIKRKNNLDFHLPGSKSMMFIVAHAHPRKRVQTKQVSEK